LIDELMSTGVDGLELDYRIPPALLADMKPALRKIPVFSVHNYFPVPDILLPSKGSGDAFLLSAVDEEERKLAVEYTKRSLRVSAEMNARNLVVHLGVVDCGSKGRELVSIYKEEGKGERYDQACQVLMNERAEKAGGFLDSLFSSLEEVIKEAERVGVSVCVENRYYPHQIPSYDEVDAILTRFEGAPVMYWHDVGHAVVQEQLGLCPHLDWLKRYGNRLAGIHFHDVIGLLDHLAPGKGDVPFGEFRPYLNDEVTKIVEVHQGVKREDLLEGIGKLRSQVLR
jgi:sugar phosphate isomerase/epimerase